MDSPYKLRLLGAPLFVAPTGPQRGPLARAQSLLMLARMAVDGPGGTPRGALAGFLWPESPTDVARHALSNLVYQVRRSVGREALSGRGDVLLLPAERWKVDYWTFQRAIEAGDHEAAVAAYNAPFLDDIRVAHSQIEKWIDATNRSLEDAYVRSLEALARGAGERGDTAAAVRWWRTAVHVDPLHSSRTGALMIWLSRSGNTAEAIRVAERHTALRRTELGLDPEPSVSSLEDRIRSGEDPALALLSPSIPDSSGDSVVARDAAPPVPDTRRSPPPDVREEYLTALFLAGQMRPEATEQAAVRLERIIAESPDFAAAHAVLGRVLIILLLSGTTRPRRATLDRAVTCAARAVALSPESGDAHASAAWVNIFDGWDLDAARSGVQRAESLGIHDPHAMALAAVTLSIGGDSEGAASLAAAAVARDPFQYVSEFWSAWITRQSGGDAAPQLQKLCERRPDSVWGLLLWALSMPGSPQKVRTLTQVILDLPAPNVLAFSIAAAARAQSGDLAHVERALALADAASEGNSQHLAKALVLSAADRIDEAGDAFILGLSGREPITLGWWRDPLVVPLLGLPRVAEAAIEAGLRPCPGTAEGPAPPRAQVETPRRGPPAESTPGTSQDGSV